MPIPVRPAVPCEALERSGEFVDGWAEQEAFTLTFIIHLTLADKLPLNIFSEAKAHNKEKVKVLCSAHSSIISERMGVGKTNSLISVAANAQNTFTSGFLMRQP